MPSMYHRVHLAMVVALVATASCTKNAQAELRGSRTDRLSVARRILGRQWGVVVLLNPITCSSARELVKALNELSHVDGIPVAVGFVGIDLDATSKEVFRIDLGLAAPATAVSEAETTSLVGVEAQYPVAIAVSTSGNTATLEASFMSRLRGWAAALFHTGQISTPKE